MTEALDLYRQALVIARRQPLRHSECIELLNVAEASHLLGYHDEAARSVFEAELIRRDLGSPVLGSAALDSPGR